VVILSVRPLKSLANKQNGEDGQQSNSCSPVPRHVTIHFVWDLLCIFFRLFTKNVLQDGGKPDFYSCAVERSSIAVILNR
jgi:hypothetical protein